MIQQEIEKAKEIYGQYGRSILEDPEMAPLIERYRDAIHGSYLAMEEAGVSAACSSCAGVTAGGCCFSGVEEWYDCHLLLINLLLERDLPLQTVVPEGCLFVGDNGCRLTARHSFCVNFLCPGLVKSLSEKRKGRLTRAVGLELLAGWKLEKSLRDWLRCR